VADGGAAPPGPRPLVETRDVGDVRIHALDGGGIRLDGGAMFGVVPKPLWERRAPADERNRIPLALRCLLVETTDALVLVDTGVGDKESERFHDIYAIENAGRPTRLEDAIRAAGHTPEDVGYVVNTHLHFDHAGGNTRRDGDAAVPAFPRARYVVQEGEFGFAQRDNERIRASYLAANYEPVAAAGLFEFLRGEVEVVPGIRVLRTPGHTPHHQSVLIESGGETACFLADLVPTTAHLPLPWIMGYDLEPLVTLESKRALLERARREGWLLIFEHDPQRAWGRLDPDSERPMLLEEEG
jgi:glyoxylase-like metal-dependent hydrolase (beta-lactamase superfamily II)